MRASNNFPRVFRVAFQSFDQWSHDECKKAHKSDGSLAHPVFFEYQTQMTFIPIPLSLHSCCPATSNPDTRHQQDVKSIKLFDEDLESKAHGGMRNGQNIFDVHLAKFYDKAQTQHLCPVLTEERRFDRPFPLAFQQAASVCHQLSSCKGHASTY